MNDIKGDKVGLLRRSMYGMRDAASLWEKLVAKKMKALGFRQGKSTPCVFWHPVKDVRTTLHGDNFASLGYRMDLEWLEGELSKEWSVQVEGYFGPPGEADCVCSMRTLNRLLAWTHEGIEWECDPRHVEILVREMGVAKANTKVTTPGIRERQMPLTRRIFLYPNQSGRITVLCVCALLT